MVRTQGVARVLMAEIINYTLSGWLERATFAPFSFSCNLQVHVDGGGNGNLGLAVPMR